MKFIGKLLLYILIALLVAIASLYFLLQTRWGAEHISAWVSENSDYHLAFGAMDHRFFRAISYRAGERHVWS
ncbi:AsmA family protein [Escherichia coli]|uniref:AsmA family protein n=1 Tax=Escherichia coli TaxID=562 RepID=A0A2X1JI84_ECOLX|nr:AsmA family protein [Escherichia coli]